MQKRRTKLPGVLEKTNEMFLHFSYFYVSVPNIIAMILQADEAFGQKAL